MVGTGKDLWNRCVLSLEWKSMSTVQMTRLIVYLLQDEERAEQTRPVSVAPATDKR